jgi:hypothetical protein
MSAGECQTKNRKNYEEADDDKPIKALDEGAVLEPPLLMIRC